MKFTEDMYLTTLEALQMSERFLGKPLLHLLASLSKVWRTDRILTIGFVELKALKPSFSSVLEGGSIH